MASTNSLDLTPLADIHSIRGKERDEKHALDEEPIAYSTGDAVRAHSSASDDSRKPLFDNTHRRLKPRHIQLIGIGGYAKKHKLLSVETAC